MQIVFFGMLQILFITLKLTDVIDWSWWWVLSPIWLPMTIVVVIWELTLIAVSRR